MNYLYLGLIQATFLTASAIACAAIAGKCQANWLLASVLYFTLYPAAGDMTHFLRLNIGHWNWTAKALAILITLLAWWALHLSRVETAWVLPSTRRAWLWTLSGTLAAVAFSVASNYVFRDHQRPNPETMLFQMTMPGLDEELAFRGVGFALIARGFFGAARNWAPLTITSLYFGLGHVVGLDHGAFKLSYAPLAFALSLGFLFGLLRLRSGSLLGPIVAHNLANTLGFLTAALP